jgi:transcriptional regulator with XRE-family HTH domain
VAKRSTTVDRDGSLSADHSQLTHSHSREKDVTAADAQPVPEPGDAFVAELKRWRDVRGLSQSALAKKVGYTPSYISKVESGQQHASVTFAEQADDVLRTGGALRRAHHESERPSRPDPAMARASGRVLEDQSAGSLVVEHDDAELYYDGQVYRATQRRKLYNASEAPITRYLIRISVDRYPGNPERSNQLYRANPLTWEEINLQAWRGHERMRWKVQHDRDAFKELWLLFENDDGHFPLYPSESTWIEYSYTVSDEKWGPWFQRAVRLPTKRLSVRLVFPAELDPVVWGMETTMTADAFPFRTAITRQHENGREVFAWATEDPPLHARFRIEWKFRASTRRRPRCKQQAWLTWRRSASSKRATRFSRRSRGHSSCQTKPRTLAASSPNCTRSPSASGPSTPSARAWA